MTLSTRPYITFDISFVLTIVDAIDRFLISNILINFLHIQNQFGPDTIGYARVHSTFHSIVSQNIALELFFLKAIYHTLPRLSGLLEEEWIPTKIFQLYSNSWLQESNHCIPLELKRQNLDNCEPGSWRLKPIGNMFT